MDLNRSWEDGMEDVFEEEEIEMAEEEIDEDDDDEDDEDELDDSSEIPALSSYSVYRKKYNLLLERCNAIQQDNELLVSRVKEVKKLWKKSLRERRLLINRLDSHGDNFRNIPVTFPFSQDENLKKAKDKKVKKSGNSDEPGPSGRGRKPKSEKEKPARDPNLPKRPQNPFFQFCKEKRDAVSHELLQINGVNPTKKELTKLLASQWNSLDSSEKTIYNERFEAEKAGYNIKMEAYRKSKYDLDLNLGSANNSPSHVLGNPIGSGFVHEDNFD